MLETIGLVLGVVVLLTGAAVGVLATHALAFYFGYRTGEGQLRRKWVTPYAKINRPFSVTQEEESKAALMEASLVNPLFGRREYVDNIADIPIAATHKYELKAIANGAAAFQPEVKRGK